MKTAVAIVTYNPDIKRLLENVEAVRPQVEQILIVDNGSVNISEFDYWTNVDYIKSPVNMGIAWGLNRSFEWAYSNGVDWMLTLDQDSIVKYDFVEKLVKIVMNNGQSKNKLGLVFPLISDPNAEAAISQENIYVRKMRFFKRKLQNWIPKMPITSGAFVNVTAVKDCGGVEEDYFIENVDFNLDLRLMRRGYVFVQSSEAVLEQQFGAPRRAVSSHNKTESGIYISGHAPWRYYYVYRNRIWLHRFFWYAPTWFLFDDIIFFFKIPVYWFCGERKLVKAMVSGIKDGLLRKKKTQNEVITRFA